jgi:GNAT superfamily N-acetyltransferase
MEFHLVQSEAEETEFTGFLHRQIREFNNRTSPHHLEARKPGAVAPLRLMVKDAEGKYLGGLAGNTFWNWLEIDDFYLPQELRGEGLGTSLLQTAEAIAIQRGCTRCFLTTFEFQARRSYEKQGYLVVGKLDNYPPGSAYYWMRKDFVTG